MKKLSIYISYLLRHHPEDKNLDMDIHGWVNTNDLLQALHIDFDTLHQIVLTDSKQRYKFNEDYSKIKACQGHSIPGIIPELTYKEVPEFLYHGTTQEALDLIYKSGHIDKMKRHAVHMQQDMNKAMQSAMRWKNKTPIILKIDARKMIEDGYRIGVSDNGVWCTETVPVQYIQDKIKVRLP